MTTSDISLIKKTARSQGINEELSQEAIKRAHAFASDAAADDYYYRLKEFFGN